MSRRGFFWFSCLCAVVVFLSANAIAGVLFRGVRIDATENNLYELAPGTAATLAEITEPIDLTFFYSRALAQQFPEIRTYGARVREMLLAYEARAGGGLRLEIVDPEPFSEEEDRAIAAGIEGVTTGEGDRLYFGLNMRNSVDDRVTIPFFSPEREPFLEYELTRRISELEAPNEAKVAIITGLPLASGAALDGSSSQGGFYVFRQMLQNFDVEVLEQDFEEIPADADILMLAHPPEMTEAQLFAIDQFVLEHGRALVFVDPFSMLSTAPRPRGAPAFDIQTSSDLAPLLAAWGVSYDADAVVLDADWNLRAAVLEGGRRVERAYPLWLGLPPEALSQEDLATTPLERGLNMPAAGSISALPDFDVDFIALVTTSENVDVIASDDAAGDPAPKDMMSSFASEGAPRVVAARLSGEFQTAYPDGRPRSDGEEEEREDAEAGEDAQTVTARGRAEIVVVADADVFDDTFYVSADRIYGETTLADNAVFILNVLDVLTGSDALVSLRSRARSNRPMELIDNLREDAEARYFEEQEQLETALTIAEARLGELEAGSREGGSLMAEDIADMSDEAEATLDELRGEVFDTRVRLRDIQRSYRADIDRLEAWLIFINVWLAPLLIALFGIGMFAAHRSAAAARFVAGLGRIVQAPFRWIGAAAGRTS